MTYTQQHLAEAAEILGRFDVDAIERTANLLAETRARGGRLFFLGVGGSAANCSHAVNDFRKICGFEAYAPTDNVSELTARTNDEGWDTVFAAWLRTSRASAKDAVKAAVMVEDVARSVHFAREAGPLIPIPQDAIDRLYDRYQHVYGQSGDARR